VSVLVGIVISCPCKTAEPIEMSFGGQTRVRRKTCAMAGSCDAGVATITAATCFTCRSDVFVTLLPLMPHSHRPQDTTKQSCLFVSGVAV